MEHRNIHVFGHTYTGCCINIAGAHFLSLFHIIVDGSVSYLWSFNAWRSLAANLCSTEPTYTIAHILHQLVPAANVVFMLRNPTDRFVSYTTYIITHILHQLLLIAKVVFMLRNPTDRFVSYTTFTIAHILLTL